MRDGSRFRPGDGGIATYEDIAFKNPRESVARYRTDREAGPGESYDPPAVAWVGRVLRRRCPMVAYC